MKLKRPIMGTDENGDEVFMASGDTISKISDAGPVLLSGQKIEDIHLEMGPDEFIGWNVTVRLTPSHKHWNELVTVDAVKLLKALE